MHFLTMFLRMTLRILFCCKVSREMLRGKSSESTIPANIDVRLKFKRKNTQIWILRLTLDKVEVLGNEVLAVVHDEDTANVEFDVVALLLRLKEVERCTTRS